MIPRYEPMLATSWRVAFSDPGWSFEPKWDGYRAVLTYDGETTSLRSRRGNDVSSRYAEISALRPPMPVVLDGEVVAFDDTGNPSFELLQRRNGPVFDGAPAVSFVVFDVLHLGSTSMIDRPFEDRLSRLEDLDLPDVVRRSPRTVGAGQHLWDAIVAQNLEGMVAKRLGSPYRPGIRSEDWRKIHHVNTVRVVVGGFTPGEGGRSSTFGSLLVGAWDGDRLRWCGAVGTGFSDEALRAIRGALDEQVRPDSPFHPDETIPRQATWVEPALVAVVGYRNWTTAGRLRHPRFVGFSDEPMEAVTWAAEGPADVR